MGRGSLPDGRAAWLEDLGFDDPVLCGGSMRPVARPDKNPYFVRLAARGLLERFNEDRRSRCLLPGLVDVMNTRVGELDLRTAGLPEGWVAEVSGDSPFEGADHLDGFVAEQACRWLGRAEESRPGTPWFLQVNFCGPHDPYDPPASHARAYRSADMPPPIPADYRGKPRWIAQRFVSDHQPGITRTRRQYAAHVAFLDEQIGLILASLRAMGQSDRTITVFTADHGEMLGDLGLYTKRVAYEPSMRVPLLMAGPGVPVGRVSDALVEGFDLNPTICRWAGVAQQPGIDARSLLPLLDGRIDDREHRTLARCQGHNYRCLRDHRWKYIQSPGDRSELYDLEADPRELHNLLDGDHDDHPEARRLLSLADRCP